jgi:hypothetical protein
MRQEECMRGIKEPASTACTTRDTPQGICGAAHGRAAAAHATAPNGAPLRPRPSDPAPVAPPLSAPAPSQITAITPFHIVTATAYGLTVYGMAGFRPGAAAIFKNGLINVLLHLIASQVGPPAGESALAASAGPPLRHPPLQPRKRAARAAPNGALRCPLYAPPAPSRPLTRPRALPATRAPPPPAAGPPRERGHCAQPGRGLHAVHPLDRRPDAAVRLLHRL